MILNIVHMNPDFKRLGKKGKLLFVFIPKLEIIKVKALDDLLMYILIMISTLTTFPEYKLKGLETGGTKQPIEI